ncbi:FliH/SctL family protein [Phycicoccus sp. Root563]|uniref:FliH/SctL family protein n=1 Tax=Phycicoccus sp. Root563 TaxID=1736562 RepID=UPI000AA34CE9|nr:FliH/SctL family protein [Phycicoccus sp. Root563]
MTSSSDLRPATVLLRSSATAGVRPALFSTRQLSHASGVVGAGSVSSQQFEEGHDAGYQEGLLAAAREQELWVEQAAGREQAARAERDRRFAAELDALRAAVADATASATVADVYAVAVPMAVEIAEALVGHHLRVDDCAARDAVERALVGIPRGSDVTVHVHPDDTELTPDSLADLVPGCAVHVVPDASVERGGCLVDIGDRTIDAQLGAALARVREVLSS